MAAKPGIAQLLDLVQSVVTAQGNLYIRELLRNKGIKAGANKPEFERNLVAAANEGRLTLADVEEWLEATEAWGNQHIYAFRISPRLAASRDWLSAPALRAALGPGQSKYWQAGQKFAFPEKLALAEIAPEPQGGIRYVWREGATGWIRVEAQDESKTVEGDFYELRAYRERKDRTVHRFVVRTDLLLACIFMQGEWNAKTHSAFEQEVRSAAAAAVAFDQLQPFDLSAVIRNVDQGDLDKTQDKVRSQRTRLSDAGYYVEFATNSSEGGYLESEPVRHIRRAATLEGSMSGTSGTFEFGTKTPTGLDRPVRFDVFAEQKRIKLRSQMSATDVWELLAFLDANGGGTGARVRTASGA